MPDVALQPTSPRLSFGTSGRREVALLALCAFVLGCSARLTPSRAGTIIRHSSAFLSGIPETRPVFDRVSALLKGSEGWTPERQEGDSYIAEISYYWPTSPNSREVGQPVQILRAGVVLRRSANGWAVDDAETRAITPTWPQLPKTPTPFFPNAAVRP